MSLLCFNVKPEVCVDLSQEGIINFLRGFLVAFENRYEELKDNLENTSGRIIEEVSDELWKSTKSVTDSLEDSSETIVEELEESNEQIIEEIKDIQSDLQLQVDDLKFLIIERNVNKTADAIFPQCPDPLNIIKKPGYYSLERNSEGGLRVQSSDVVVNLNDFTFIANCGTEPVVKIEPGYKNVEIINGKIQGNSSVDGIEIGDNCQGITIENVTIFSCNRGVYAAGSAGNEVKGCKIKNCEAQFCSTGFLFEYANSFLLDNVKALNCKQAGFSQSNSQFNVYQGCESFQTSNDQADERALGFASFDGQANLFRECIADGTAVENSNFCKSAIGFLLEGQEIGTKIVNCIAISTDASSAADANAYGIFLNPIRTFTQGLSVAGETSFAVDVNDIAWSSCEKYLVVARQSATNVPVLEFDGSSLTQVAAFPPGVNFIGSVDWSPTRYIAVGTGGADPTDVRVLRFSSSSANLISVASVNSGVNGGVFSVSWSPTGKYLAVVGRGIGEVYVFDENAGTLVYVSGFIYEPTLTEIVWSIDWSPDDEYLAIGGDPLATQPEVRVFRFDGTTPWPVVATFDPGQSIRSVEWSPNGKFLAIGGWGSPQVRVLEFNGTSSFPVVATFPHTENVNSVTWSPDGKYLAFGSQEGGGTQELKVLSFNGSSLVEVSSYEQGQDIEVVSWSPGGSNLVLGGENGLPNNVKVFSVMSQPSNCVIEGNNVLDTKDVGIGISDGGSNFFINNICFNNDVNLFNVPNSYLYDPNDVALRQPRFYDNIDHV